MPPLIALRLGLWERQSLVRWCVKEAHRVNFELDEVRGAKPVDPPTATRCRIASAILRPANTGRGRSVIPDLPLRSE